jgi:hypothetical protein
VTEDELGILSEKVLVALSKGPLDPSALKNEVGDAVRSFGEEGKKRGVTTSLPLVLGRLQNSGDIRRVPVNGRLDQQRYSYVRWDNSPLRSFDLTYDDAMVELARKYFSWVGPASAKHFQWFSGLGVGAAKKVLEPLGLVPVEEGSELFLLPEDLDTFRSFRRPSEPQYALITALDGLTLHRRDLAATVDEADTSRSSYGEKGRLPVGGLMELHNHAIMDRGRLIGVWEFDALQQELVYEVWTTLTSELKRAIEETESFIRDQLGDARSFSLDSPESRKPRIAALRNAASALA